MPETPKMSVKCCVENCHYNKAKTCHADNLEVNAMGDRTAQTSDGTSCVTFRKHDSMK